MRPTLVLFDIDGTLIDTGGAGRLSLESSFRSVFGLGDVASTKTVRFDGKTDPTIMADMARAAGLPEGVIEARYVELQTAYLAALRFELQRPNPRRRVLPGVRILLDTLFTRPDVSLGLITGNIEEGARVKLDHFDLNRYFRDGGFSSDHPERGEIARIAHQKLSRRAGFLFPPDRVMIVGDSELDVACAHANNFKSIAVATSLTSRERLAAANPHAVLDDLTDVDGVLGVMGLNGR